MFEKLKTKTLWTIAIASGVCFVLSPIIATPIGTFVDNVLLSIFAKQWPTSHEPYLVWQSIALGERIFAIATAIVALLALVCGLWAAWTLYRRRHGVYELTESK